MITEIDSIKTAITEDKLFQRAVSDCVLALMRRATVGRSIADATTQLDRLREQFEKVKQP